jgi:integrase
MRKEGYRESTIQSTIQALKAVARRANLLDPESTKTYLASAKVSENRKCKLADDLARFYHYMQIRFEKPRYRRIDKIPFIPSQLEVDQLIAGVGKKMSTFLRLLSETGMRVGEAWNLKWTDIDCERGVVNVTPEKGSNARQLKISSQLIAIMNQLPPKQEPIFRNPSVDPIRSLKCHRKNFEKQRRRVADRLQNPRIQAISFKSLRHWKATTEYHKTRDILHVMTILGHKNIQNTLVYTHLIKFEGDEYVCKIAKTVDDAKILIEDGFDHVTDIEDMKLFRKRK